MTPRERYADLIRQGYTAEHAARRSGFTDIPAAARAPRLARPAPTEAQKAWKRSGFTRTPRPAPTPARADGPLRLVVVPPVIPAPLPKPPGPARHRPPAERREDMSWLERGVCAQVDPEAWFPEKGGNNKAVKRVCRRCDVIDACLAYALAHPGVEGIWGGTSAQERRRLTAERAG